MKWQCLLMVRLAPWQSVNLRAMVGHKDGYGAYSNRRPWFTPSPGTSWGFGLPRGYALVTRATLSDDSVVMFMPHKPFWKEQAIEITGQVGCG